MKKHLLPLSAICMVVLATTFSACSSPKHSNEIQVQRIWEGDYCAFTSLIKYNDQYYCSFREAAAHVFDENGKAEGKARIIVSKDGENWQSAALFSKEGMDLRDPKLSIMPDGRMMVIMGGSVYEDKKLVHMYPQVSFSDDGVHFTEPEPVVIDSAICEGKEWIWRVTWHEGVGYGVVYGNHYALLKTTDGIHFDLVKELEVENNPGETALAFLSDGTMLLIARCEGENKHGVWGRSLPPYTDWDWTEMNILLGGPDIMVLGDTLTILGTRSLYGSEKTMMLKGTTNGDFEEVCILPSGGDDNSYTGMVVVNDELWVTYYSRHELPKAAIYMAKLPMHLFTTPCTNTYYKRKW